MTYEMSFTHDDDDGKLKHDLITGLCDEVNFKLGEVVEPLLIKRCTAALKYLLGYLLDIEYAAVLRISCMACYKLKTEHSCLNTETKSRKFYRLMITVTKVVLKKLSDQVTKEYKLRKNILATHFWGMPCVLFYKCLTIWKPLMKKQFLNRAIPKGIDRSLFQILQKELKNGKEV